MGKELSEEEMDEIYRDQGGEWIGIPGYSIMSFGGIHLWDSEYAEAIQRGNVDPLFLADNIAKNLHLHRKIKDNLIGNLKSRHKDKSKKIDQQVKRIYAKLDHDLLLGKRQVRGFNLLEGLRVKLERTKDIEYSIKMVQIIEEASQKVGAL